MDSMCWCKVVQYGENDGGPIGVNRNMSSYIKHVPHTHHIPLSPNHPVYRKWQRTAAN